MIPAKPRTKAKSCPRERSFTSVLTISFSISRRWADCCSVSEMSRSAQPGSTSSYSRRCRGEGTGPRNCSTRSTNCSTTTPTTLAVNSSASSVASPATSRAESAGSSSSGSSERSPGSSITDPTVGHRHQITAAVDDSAGPLSPAFLPPVGASRATRRPRIRLAEGMRGERPRASAEGSRATPRPRVRLAEGMRAEPPRASAEGSRAPRARIRCAGEMRREPPRASVEGSRAHLRPGIRATPAARGTLARGICPYAHAEIAVARFSSASSEGGASPSRPCSRPCTRRNERTRDAVRGGPC